MSPADLDKKLASFPENAQRECRALHALCASGGMLRLGVLEDPVVGWTPRDDFGDDCDEFFKSDEDLRHAATAILLGYDGGGGAFYLSDTGHVAMLYDYQWQHAKMSSLGAFLWADLQSQLDQSDPIEGTLSDEDLQAALWNRRRRLKRGEQARRDERPVGC